MARRANFAKSLREGAARPLLRSTEATAVAAGVGAAEATAVVEVELGATAAAGLTATPRLPEGESTKATAAGARATATRGAAGGRRTRGGTATKPPTSRLRLPRRLTRATSQTSPRSLTSRSRAALRAQLSRLPPRLRPPRLSRTCLAEASISLQTRRRRPFQTSTRFNRALCRRPCRRPWWTCSGDRLHFKLRRKPLWVCSR